MILQILCVQNNGYVVVMSNMTRAKGGTSTSGSDTFVRLAPQSPAIGLRSPAHPSFGGPAGLQSPQHALCAHFLPSLGCLAELHSPQHAFCAIPRRLKCLAGLRSPDNALCAFLLFVLRCLAGLHAVPSACVVRPPFYPVQCSNGCKSQECQSSELHHPDEKLHTRSLRTSECPSKLVVFRGGGGVPMMRGGPGPMGAGRGRGGFRGVVDAVSEGLSSANSTVQSTAPTVATWASCSTLQAHTCSCTP
jgi:hypothetical protein